MISPIEVLLDKLGNTIVNIAPEKKAEFEELHNARNFTFTVENNCAKGVFAINTLTREMLLDISDLELLWISGFYFRTVYNDMQKAREDKKPFFDTRDFPDSTKAILLYQWIHTKINNKDYSTWPKNLPHPIKNPKPLTLDFANNQMFHAAIAWIFHHEIAHARLNHSSFSNNYTEDENEADKEATKWIFSNELVDDEQITLRGMGMAVALLYINSIDFEKRKFKSLTHPLSFQRLYDCFDMLKIDEDHLLYQFIVGIMNMYMHSKGINYEPNHDGTFKYHLKKYCESLQKHIEENETEEPSN